MYQLPFPLESWVAGGYPEVVRQTGWSLPRARREVHKAIRKQGWRPIGHQGYVELREALRRGDHLNHDLI